jgi:hypothetical protein
LVTQARELADDLVIGMNVVSGCTSATGQAVDAHAQCRADDAALGNGRIQHAMFAVFALQPSVQRNTPPKIPSSRESRRSVAPHGHIHGRVSA